MSLTLRPAWAGPEPLGGGDLRPRVRPRFRCLMLALLTAAAAAGCADETNAPPRPSPATAAARRPTTANDPELRSAVERTVEHALEQWLERKTWNESTGLRLVHLIGANPPVKTPRIPTCCGNSFGGLFDTEAARRATRELFAAYGIEVRPGVRLRGSGYEFVADGYDPARKVGFRLMTYDARTRLPDDVPVPPPADRHLDASELPALDAAVKAGELNLFVADASAFPRMDGDVFTPMQYYLASVVDYLNWVTGDRRIELNKVFGELPGANRKRADYRNWPALTGGDFEADGDAGGWSVTNGTVSVTTDWSSFGEKGLLVDLQPGGEVAYTPSTGLPIELSRQYLGFDCGLYCGDPAAGQTRFVVTLVGEGDQRCELTTRLSDVRPRWERVDGRSGPPPFGRLAGVTIRTDSPRPIRFYIDDIGVYTQAYADELERRRKALDERQSQIERERREVEERRKQEVERLVRQLEAELPAFELNGVPAREAFAYFADRLPGVFRVEWGPLRATGVRPDTPLSFRSDRTRFVVAFERFLSATGSGLSFSWWDGFIRVSTHEGISHRRYFGEMPRGQDWEANGAAERKLHRALPAVKLDGVRLDEAFETLAGAAGVRIAIDWPKLEAVNVRPDLVVELDERRITADDAFRLILLEVAADAPVRTCVWDGVLVISTEAAFADRRYTPPPR